jgi:hypothetical protein
MGGTQQMSDQGGTPTTTTEQDGTDGTEDAGGGEDHAAEVEKWKALARKHEDRAKANSSAAKELEQLRQASMSDLEKAVAIARQEARTEALRESGTRLVDASVRLAAAGRGVDVDALLDGLDRNRFLTDEGEPNEKAILQWVDRLVPKPDTGSRPFPDLGQGSRAAALPLNGDPLLADLKAKLGIS